MIGEKHCVSWHPRFWKFRKGKNKKDPDRHFLPDLSLFHPLPLEVKSNDFAAAFPFKHPSGFPASQMSSPAPAEKKSATPGSKLLSRSWHVSHLVWRCGRLKVALILCQFSYIRKYMGNISENMWGFFGLNMVEKKSSDLQLWRRCRWNPSMGCFFQGHVWKRHLASLPDISHA